MSKKRYQECNWLGKLWRHRFYIFVPFKYVWFMYVVPFKVGKDEVVDGEMSHTDEYYVETGKNLWLLLMGIASSDMNWTFTMEEVMGKLNRNYGTEED